MYTASQVVPHEAHLRRPEVSQGLALLRRTLLRSIININNINNIISCYCTVKTIYMLQLRPCKCYS